MGVRSNLNANGVGIRLSNSNDGKVSNVTPTAAPQTNMAHLLTHDIQATGTLYGSRVRGLVVKQPPYPKRRVVYPSSRGDSKTRGD